ncbi:MAG TPA: extracellular solute-binding protein [Clostridia bacterium]
MIKRLLSGVVAASMAISLAACNSGNNPTQNPASTEGSTKPADLKGDISFWHFNKDEAPKIVDGFKKQFPNVNVKLTVVSDRDQQYVNKLTAALKAGSGVPDIFTAESAFVRRVVELDGGWDDLTAKVDPIKSDIAPYTLEVGTDKDGKIRAISHQVTSGGIGYKRALAKQYLGTDDPGQVSAYFASEDKMLEAGKIIKEKSGGKVALFPGWEELIRIYLGGRTDGWIKDGKLVIDPKVTDLIDFAKKLEDNGYVKELRQFDPAWAASIADDNTAMAYCVPTWGVPYIIASNDKKAQNGGRWGIAKAPAPYFWGGTWYGVYNKSANKETAWELIKWYCTDKEHLKDWNKATGDIPSSISVLNEGAASSDVDKVTGQNLFKFYSPFVGNINGKVLTTYDDTVDKAFIDAERAYLAGKLKSKDDVIKTIKNTIKTNLKDVKVD